MRSARFNRLTRLIGSALGKDSPSDSCPFVGQGAGDDIRVSPSQHGPDSFAERIQRLSMGELLRIPQFDGNPAGGDGANAGDAQEPLATFILLGLLHDFLLDWPDRFVQRLEVGT